MKKSKGIKKYKLVVTEMSWVYKVQHRKIIAKEQYMYDPHTQTMVLGLPGNGGMLHGGGQMRKNWDNYNSINNKIQFKFKK